MNITYFAEMIQRLWDIERSELPMAFKETHARLKDLAKANLKEAFDLAQCCTLGCALEAPTKAVLAREKLLQANGEPHALVVDFFVRFLVDQTPGYGDEFARHEVSSIYTLRGSRFVVSLIIGYGRDVQTPEEAARAALDATRDMGADGTTWAVFDRATQKLSLHRQCEFADDRSTLPELKLGLIEDESVEREDRPADSHEEAGPSEEVRPSPWQGASSLEEAPA